MGHGISSEVLIYLDQTSQFYLTGEIVSGTVGLNIIQEEVEVNEIYVQLKGEIGYTRAIYVKYGTGISREKIEYDHIPVYAEASSIVEFNVTQEVIFKRGQYFWPFQFQLPDHLPPTINKHETYPHVKYYLKVVVHKQCSKSQTKVKYLTVYPCINLLENSQYLQSIQHENNNRKQVILKATLNKSGYVPGELMDITLEIENPRKICIQHVDLSMLQTYHIQHHKRECIIFKTTLPEIINSEDEQIQEISSIIIPSIPLPPSYRFQGGIRRSASVKISYILEFAVKVQGMFTNFDVYFPIKLGTGPKPDLDQPQTFNPMTISYASNSEQSIFSTDDLPPSYDSIVQNMI